MSIIPGPAQWVEDLVLLQLWCRLQLWLGFFSFFFFWLPDLFYINPKSQGFPNVSFHDPGSEYTHFAVTQTSAVRSLTHYATAGTPWKLHFDLSLSLSLFLSCTSAAIQVQLRFDPLPRNFHMLQLWLKKEEKKKKKQEGFE